MFLVTVLIYFPASHLLLQSIQHRGFALLVVLHIRPTEISAALKAHHRVAPSVLLDVDLTLRTSFANLLDGLFRCPG